MKSLRERRKKIRRSTRKGRNQGVDQEIVHKRKDTHLSIREIEANQDRDQEKEKEKEVEDIIMTVITRRKKEIEEADREAVQLKQNQNIIILVQIPQFFRQKLNN